MTLEPAPPTTVTQLATERRPWHSPLLYVGLGMLAAGIGAYGLLWALDQGEARAVLFAIGTFFVAGKEAGIPLGVTLYGGEPVTIGVALLWTDVAMTFVLFPFVDAAMDGAHRNKGIVGGMVRSTRRRAEKKRKLIDRYGGVGLFLFMLVPFGFNGPLVAMVLAHLAGLRPLPTMVAMLAAVTVTTAAWTVLFVQLEEFVGLVPGWLPLTVALTVAAIAIGTTIVEGMRERRREKAEEAAASAEP
ncbi:MAG: hypothetical protein QOD77_1632 [Thermoplasmata archaeon]|jgi:uncharacterized membrane protein|nr:hypothetical protein [Thermoplasmata archaeon]